MIFHNAAKSSVVTTVVAIWQLVGRISLGQFMAYVGLIYNLENRVRHINLQE